MTTGQDPATVRVDPSTPSLAGRRVLVPRPGAEDPLAQAVAQAGGEVLSVGLTETVPAPAAEVDRALDLAGAAWLVLTSARTVAALAEHAGATGDPLPERLTRAIDAGTRVAVVGPATARALAETGHTAHLRAGAPESATTLLRAFPAAGHTRQRVVLPCSAIAAPELAEGLRTLGWMVDRIAVYTTRAATLDDATRTRLTRPWPDVVLLTAGSTVRALVDLLGQPPAEVAVAAIGAASAQAAHDQGIRVDAVATEATPAGLVSAAAHALRHRPDNPGAHG